MRYLVVVYGRQRATEHVIEQVSREYHEDAVRYAEAKAGQGNVGYVQIVDTEKARAIYDTRLSPPFGDVTATPTSAKAAQ